MVVSNNSLSETPLCSLPYVDFTYIESIIALTQTPVSSQVFNESLLSFLTLAQAESNDLSWGIKNVLSLIQTLDCSATYNMALDSALDLELGSTSQGEYTADLVSSLQLRHEAQMGMTYIIEICDYFGLRQKIANVIDIEIESVIDLSMIEGDSLESRLFLQQLIETNMDEISCTVPFGKAGDASLSSLLNLLQSIQARTVYNISIEHTLTLLNTMAWR